MAAYRCKSWPRMISGVFVSCTLHIQVPYAIHESLTSNTLLRAYIVDAIRHYHEYTPVRWIPRTTERDYVVFRQSNDVCQAYVGRMGTNQHIFLDGTGLCAVSHIVHEMGHALGMWHTQMRADRDEYVTINWDNISPAAVHNFNKYTETCDDCGRDVLEYDYASLMHYGARDFVLSTAPSSATVIDVVADKYDAFAAKYGRITIGQRVGFSALDIEQLTHVYGQCIEEPPPGMEIALVLDVCQC
jgi:Astacin (Peptidase family M12A)